MGNSILKRRLPKWTTPVCTALLLAYGSSMVTSCKDDLLTGTPEWLGSSIYEELESRGNFTQTLALINDPMFLTDDQRAKGETETEYAKTLRRTGSRTLFVADDEAWARYFKKKGVRGMSDLSAADKKMLFKSAMVNSAYLIELLSNKSTNNAEPLQGACLRRESLQDPMDRVPVLKPDQFPELLPTRVDASNKQIDYWGYLRGRDSILIMQDENSQSMIHFLPDYMASKNITNDDYKILTNGVANDVTKSYINGQLVVEQDVTCQNGYIHVLSEVPEPLDNMANVIGQKPQFSIFSKLLDRYSYPEYSAQATATYNSLYNLTTGRTDSVFVKRYFNSDNSNSRGNNSHNSFSTGTSTIKANTLLLFDPGWNRYRVYTGAGNLDFQDDAAAMLVPTDEAMQRFFDGSALKERYANWDEVPDNVVDKLLNNHMLSSFSATVPSKFNQLKNSAGDEMGITTADVDSCFTCNNGVIYQLNTVFTAPEYKSVFFPAIIRGTTDMSTIYNAVYASNSAWTLGDYQAYLNSTASKYSFIIPMNGAMLNYVDPVTLLRQQDDGGSVMYEFYMDENNPDVVSAHAYNYTRDEETDSLVKTDLAITRAQPTSAMIQNRLRNLLDNTIIVQTEAEPAFHQGQNIYVSRSGAPVIVEFGADGQVTALGGSAEYEKGQLIPVERIYNQLENGGNGISYVVSTLPTPTNTSPYAALADSVNHPDFSLFKSLLQGCSFMKNTIVGSEKSWQVTLDNAIEMLNAYHYTMYVPSNDEVQQLINDGKLPTWDDFDDWSDYLNHPEDTTYTKAEVDSIQHIIRSTIENFVRYHIHDNSVYFDGTPISNQAYETQNLDTLSNRFRRLTVTNDGANISVTDLKGTQHQVVKGTDSNVMTTQYLFCLDQGEASGKSTLNNSRFIYSTSFVVLHKITGYLSYSDAQFLDPQNPLPKAPVFPEEGDEEETPATPVKRFNYHRR